ALNLILYKGAFPDADSIKNMAFELKNEVENLVLVLAADLKSKPFLTVMLADSLVADYGLNASDLVRDMARAVNGGGGGQPFYATAGGKELGGLDKALEIARGHINAKTGTAV
ncbi:MAG: DHHA1 domain-containing protein, partial [Cyclobacteriaceae bacterium]|nr:DHHA1 domain-containing protein [Cyclobacteriaceae bacterium]